MTYITCVSNAHSSSNTITNELGPKCLPTQSRKSHISKATKIKKNELMITANAVVIGAAGSCPGKNGERVGQGVGHGNDGHAYADGGGGPTVQSQYNFASAALLRRLEIPDFPIPVSLHIYCSVLFLFFFNPKQFLRHNTHK